MFFNKTDCSSHSDLSTIPCSPKLVESLSRSVIIMYAVPGDQILEEEYAVPPEHPYAPFNYFK